MKSVKEEKKPSGGNLKVEEMAVLKQPWPNIYKETVTTAYH